MDIDTTQIDERNSVLQIIAGFAVESPLGGIERFGIELARQLYQRKRFQPVLLGLWDWGTRYDSEWQRRLLDEGMPTLIGAPWRDRSPYLAFVHSLRRLADELDGRRIGIIHSHSQFGDVAALLLRHKVQARALVRTVHNEREWPKRPFRRLFLTNGLFPFVFDAEVGVAQQVTDNLNRRPMARLRKKKAECIYNALDFRRFSRSPGDKTTARRRLQTPSDAVVIGTVGRLTAQKGYDVLLQAFSSVQKDYPNAYLVLVGAGELQTSLHIYAQHLGIDRRTVFTGAMSQIEAVYPAFDVFVSSSLWEGLPTVILEAMAAGIPVVATAVSGSSELVQHGVTGYLAQPGDPTSLAHYIVETLRYPEKAAKLASCALAGVRERFSIQNVAQQYEALYARVLQGK
ncbi:MAG: glycosyltransferase family 1 protein [Gammaproteobacteria bacterium]|nr:MAG: glycosyltransferase family 1 protein [Gammaproteobacteria bacterium]